MRKKKDVSFSTNARNKHRTDQSRRLPKTSITYFVRKSKKYVKVKSSRRSGGGAIKCKYDCHVRSLGIPSLSSNATIIGGDKKIEDNGNEIFLDMYAYHQGREGMEARDADTGELLCTQQVTDTNHDFDAPKSTFSIEIEFPLEDDDDDVDDDDNFQSNDNNSTKKHGIENKSDNNDTRNACHNFTNGSRDDNNNTATAESAGRSSTPKNIAMYREILTWDLLDPNTPTPLAFAASIGKEYGLSFGQTIDLAARIDRQIEKHVTDTSQYREAIAVRENVQELLQSRKLGPVLQPYRYDESIQTEKEGGTFKQKKETRGGPAKNRPSATTGGSRQNRNGGSLASDFVLPKKPLSRKKASAAKVTSEVSLEDELDDELLAEVQKRSHADSVTDVGQNQVLESENNLICHICKKRVPLGYHFSCSINNHSYCESHVQVREFFVEFCWQFDLIFFARLMFLWRDYEFLLCSLFVFKICVLARVQTMCIP